MSAPAVSTSAATATPTTTTPTTAAPLPYSTSSGAAYAAFDKLQGTKNYATWKGRISTVLESLRQWGIVDGTIIAPTPADPAAPMADETAELLAFKVRSVSVFMEISFRVADHIDTTLGKSKDLKEAWDCLEKRYGTGQDGLQSILMMKLQLMKWDGSSSIFTHRDSMVNLRTELADTGMVINDHTFFLYFTSSLPRSLDLFVTLYDDGRSHDVNVICDRFARYEMRLKLDDTRIAKNDGVPDTPVAMFSQASSSNPKGKKGKGRDFKNVTCYGCGKKGHIKAKCQDKPKEAKETKAGEKKDDKSKPAKAADNAHKAKPATGMLYMALTLGAQASSGDSDGHFYIDSGASNHLFPTKGDLHAYRKFIKPVEISAADGGKIYAYGSGTLRVATSANGLE